MHETTEAADRPAYDAGDPQTQTGREPESAAYDAGDPQTQTGREPESAASTPSRPETRPDEVRPQPPAADAGTEMPAGHADTSLPPREAATAAGAPASESAGLLPWQDAEGYRRQWESIQARFVDDPRDAIERADALVVDVLRRMAEVREEHRSRLRSSVGDSSSTEDLLGTMRSYRALFDGLLKT